MQQGQLEYQQGRLEAAIQLFYEATQSQPARAEGWFNLGIAQAEAGALESGLVSLQEAVGLSPDVMLVHMAVGDVRRQLGHWTDAIAAYQRAVSLQRTPMSLNQLASALRVERKATQSENLYREALQIDPDFSLAKVNLATVQVELQNFEEARSLLASLEGLPLPPAEREETTSTSLALGLYFHVRLGLEMALQKGSLEYLHQVLGKVPERMLNTDWETMDNIRRYADSARKLSLPAEPIVAPLPEDWPLIEALFMIPLVETVAEYRRVKNNLASNSKLTGELLVSINMEAVVHAARAAGDVLQDPLMADTHLRYWHALATNNIPNMLPGHFKMTRNMVHGGNVKRTSPHLVAGTVRSYFGEIYSDLPAGLARGLVSLMAIADIHAFEDGNGRIVMSLLNRELEWAGQMPVLFNQELGFGGQLDDAIRAVRRNNGDISKLIPVIRKGQRFAREFCAELAQS